VGLRAERGWLVVGLGWVGCNLGSRGIEEGRGEDLERGERMRVED